MDLSFHFHFSFTATDCQIKGAARMDFSTFTFHFSLTAKACQRTLVLLIKPDLVGAFEGVFKRSGVFCMCLNIAICLFLNLEQMREFPSKMHLIKKSKSSAVFHTSSVRIASNLKFYLCIIYQILKLLNGLEF